MREEAVHRSQLLLHSARRGRSHSWSMVSQNLLLHIWRGQHVKYLQVLMMQIAITLWCQRDVL